MQIPLQITFHGIVPSPALEQAIRKRAARLERFHPHLMSCHAAVEQTARHKQQGKEFQVRLDIKVAGGEVVVNHDHSEDAYVALRDAFDAARRQLEDLARRQRESG